MCKSYVLWNLKLDIKNILTLNSQQMYYFILIINYYISYSIRLTLLSSYVIYINIIKPYMCMTGIFLVFKIR